MRKVAQLGRRAFLMQVGQGSFAVLAEVTLGLGRRGLAVALGGSGLAVACQPIQRIRRLGCRDRCSLDFSGKGRKIELREITALICRQTFQPCHAA